MALVLVGCGPIQYTVNITPASTALGEAESAGAKELAPFEYYYAEAHLEKAREEAAEASYEDAVRFAKTAKEYADRATTAAREK
ncbi:MAG: DUF4398 domain-containing protein [Myxococcales bacterium]|nr:DUF4398 domain-containing protein [Myxococcales bacterium]